MSLADRSVTASDRDGQRKAPGSLMGRAAGAAGFDDWIARAAILVTIIAVAPLVFIGQAAFDAGWPTFSGLVFRWRVAELVGNTAALIAITMPLCMLAGIGLAWLVERSDLPGRRALAILAVAPLAIPAFVHSYAWVGAFPGMGGIFGGVLVSVLAYFPFLYLPIAAALRRLDPALEDVAASIGLGPWAVFARVVLPQLRVALCGGALLAGVHLLAEYGLFAMMRFDTFTTAIVDQFQASYSGPAAISLGVVLIAGCASLLLLEAWLRGDRRYARVGSGAAKVQSRTALGHWTAPCLVASFGFVGIGLAVPLLTVGRWLWLGGSSAWASIEVPAALAQTIGLALSGALLATVAAFPIAWLAVRRPGALSRLVESGSYFVGAVPGVIVALALVAFTVRFARPLYQSVPTLLLAYCILFLPRAVVGLRGSLAQIPKSLEDVAGSLGRPPLAALRDVTLRIAAPGVGSALALVALGIANELTATLMLAPNGSRTLATQFWAYSSEIDYVAAAPYALLMVTFSAPMTLLLFRHR